MLRKTKLTTAIVLALTVGVMPALAQQSPFGSGGSWGQSQIDPQVIFSSERNNTVRVDRWSYCRDVTGQVDNPLMIPTRDKDEWIPSSGNSFLGAGANGANTTRCMSHIEAKPATWCAAHPGATFGMSTKSTNSSFEKAKLSPDGAFYIKYSNSNGEFGRTGLSDSSALRKTYSITGYSNFGPDSRSIYRLLMTAWSSRASVTLDVADIDHDTGALTYGPSLSYTDKTKNTSFESIAISSAAKHVVLSRKETDKPSFGGWGWGGPPAILSRDLLIFTRTIWGFSETQTISMPTSANAPEVSISTDGAEILVYNGDASPAVATSYLLDAATGQYKLDRTYTAGGATPIPMKMAPGGTVAIGVAGTKLSTYTKNEPTEPWVLDKVQTVPGGGSPDQVTLQPEGDAANFDWIDSNRVLRLSDLSRLAAPSKYALTGLKDGETAFYGTKQHTFSFTSGSAGGTTIINNNGYTYEYRCPN